MRLPAVLFAATLLAACAHPWNAVDLDPVELGLGQHLARTH